MRSLLITLAAILTLVISAQAQTKPHLKHVPPLSRDQFLPGITAETTPGELGTMAARARWTLLEESPESVRYQTEPTDSRYSSIYTIFFREGKVRAMTASISGPMETEKGISVEMMLDVIGAVMEKRAETVTADANRMVLMHTTPDGRPMRVIVDRPSPTHLIIEAAVDFADENLAPLK